MFVVMSSIHASNLHGVMVRWQELDNIWKIARINDEKGKVGSRLGGLIMEKSDVFKAIIKIQEHCYRQLSCEGCEFSYIDEYDDCMCLLGENPKNWDTDDIPYNILEEEE